MKGRKTDPEELLAAVADAIDDGFLPASALLSSFPKLSHRDLVVLDRAVGVDQRRAVGAVQTTVAKPLLAPAGKYPCRTPALCSLPSPSRHSRVPSAAIVLSVLAMLSTYPRNEIDARFRRASESRRMVQRSRIAAIRHVSIGTAWTMRSGKSNSAPASPSSSRSSLSRPSSSTTTLPSTLAFFSAR